MSEIHVRAARSTDEATVLAMVHAEMKAQAAADPRFRLRPDAVSRYAVYLRDRMREIDSTVFVAEIDGRIVGTATASIRIQEAFFDTRRFGYLSDLVVEEAARRLGVGRELWRRVTLWFRGLGVSVVRLHIAARSEAARSFWESVGAKPFLIESWIDLPVADEEAHDESLRERKPAAGGERGERGDAPGAKAPAEPGATPAATADTIGGEG